MAIRYARLKRFTRRQERALRKSITEKWKPLASENPPANEPECALCDEFDGAGQFGIACDGCPIAVVTGEDQCEGTPYYQWSYSTWRDGERDTLAARPHATRELRFLKTLLRRGLKVREAQK